MRTNERRADHSKKETKKSNESCFSCKYILCLSFCSLLSLFQITLIISSCTIRLHEIYEQSNKSHLTTSNCNLKLSQIKCIANKKQFFSFDSKATFADLWIWSALTIDPWAWQFNGTEIRFTFCFSIIIFNINFVHTISIQTFAMFSVFAAVI